VRHGSRRTPVTISSNDWKKPVRMQLRSPD
jgi:hypothetical protein